MDNFFQLNKEIIIFILLVVGIFMILRLFTNLTYNWYINNRLNKYSREKQKVALLVKRILNTLWVVLAIISLAFLFVEEKEYADLRRNYRITLYLGIVTVITMVAAVSLNLWFKNSIQKKISNKQDPTSFKFLRYIAVILVYTTGILFACLAFPSLRGVAQTALGGAGVIAIIAGVASQEALSNIVGGLFIISFKPFKIGDTIKVSESMVGTVTDITLRHTIIRNYENKMIVIPNVIINKEKLVNFDLGENKCCNHIEFDISYDSDIDLAKEIIRQECENHSFIMDNRSEVDKANGVPKVIVRVISLNDWAVRIRAWAWTNTFSDSFILKCDVLESIKKRFEKENIEIPFPYQNLIIKGEKSNSKV